MAETDPQSPEEKAIRARIADADDRVQRVLAGNLRRLLEHANAHRELAWPRSISSLVRATGIARTTVYGMLLEDEPTGPTGGKLRRNNPKIENVAAIATAYGLQPWELLHPDLDPAAPPAKALIARSVYDELWQRIGAATKILDQSGGVDGIQVGEEQPGGAAGPDQRSSTNGPLSGEQPSGHDDRRRRGNLSKRP